MTKSCLLGLNCIFNVLIKQLFAMIILSLSPIYYLKLIKKKNLEELKRKKWLINKKIYMKEL